MRSLALALTLTAPGGPAVVAPSAPAALAPSLSPAAPSLLPLTPSLAAPVPVALTPVPLAAAAAPETPAAARDAEFRRLILDLMGADAEKSAAATLELRRLKDAHVNKRPEAKKTGVLELKPMQIPAGMIEVAAKAADIKDLKSKQAEEWLKERSVPTLEDYKGRKRPVDHHHEARASWEAGEDHVWTHRYFDDEMHARIKALPRAEYYAVTKAMGLFYDRDQFGAGPHDPNHLPEDVRGMADDPFRSLAWRVRKLGGYDKTDVPFAEFQWANFFRERVKTYPTKADFEKAAAEALALAHSDDAKALPGWKSK